MKIYHSAADALRAAGLPVPDGIDAIERRYPALISDYYAGLIDPALGAADPIYRQCVPDPAELADSTSSFDPLAEEAQMPAPRLIRRFDDRAVLLATARCATRCRFCFRKRTWASGEPELADISDAELADAARYLGETPQIREVLVTGGDPMFLPLARLRAILDALAALPNIEIVRVATRLPVVAPALITDELAELCAAHPGLWVATHFNHPRELTPESCAALARFVRRGVPVVNQTVLLRGVNDDAEVLERLFRGLVANRVKPHYLFHVDPVRGVRHFATGIACGLEILRQFRPRLSSLAVPTFAIDLPEGGGKVALQPEYRQDGKYPDIHNQSWIDYPEPTER